MPDQRNESSAAQDQGDVQWCGDDQPHEAHPWSDVVCPGRSAADSHFYVYAITFDQDTFGIFATREAAEASLARQIEQGGPAWEDCKVERWRVEGTPEVAS